MKLIVDVGVQPHEDAMKNTGCTLASDGWTDPRKRPLLNMCVVTHKGTLFKRAVDTTGQTKVPALLMGSGVCAKY